MCGIGAIVRVCSLEEGISRGVIAHAPDGRIDRKPRHAWFHERCHRSASPNENINDRHEDGSPARERYELLACHNGMIRESWLDTLEDSVRHRGPDGRGRFRWAGVVNGQDGGEVVIEVAIVHRRLSVIDHADGGQPMVSERGRDDKEGLVAVVFNGCIYNHRELRAELERAGHGFVSDHADTEVLIHGWREWGSRLCDRLDGMYAFVLWDAERGELVCGRDPAGEKPLYLLRAPGERPMTCACSVAAGLRDLLDPGRDRSPLHRGAVAQWLAHGWTTLRTPVSRVEQVTTRRGIPTCMIPSAGGADDSCTGGARRDSGSTRHARDTPNEGLASELDRLLRESVTARLDADVPVGVFLSGGIDSSLIARYARESRPDIRAYTVRMPDARIDESGPASAVAKHIGIRHEILDCNPDPAGDLVKLIEGMGLPFGDSSLLPTYWVSKAVRQSATVALSGDGGDELFGGYRRHQAARWLGVSRWIAWTVPTGLLRDRDPGSGPAYARRLIEAARGDGYNDLLRIFPMSELKRVVRGVEGGRSVPVQDPLRHDFEHYLPGDILRKTDTASMAVALEVRAPFLAREVVEKAFATPMHVLMPGGKRKGLLREVARRYFPGDIVDRPKQGFAIPIGEWFRNDFGSMRTLLYDKLERAEPFGPDRLGINQMINMDYVRQMLREHDDAGGSSVWSRRGRDHSQRLYMLLVLAIWADWFARTDGV